MDRAYAADKSEISLFLSLVSRARTLSLANRPSHANSAGILVHVLHCKCFLVYYSAEFMNFLAAAVAVLVMVTH
jgi:hypothetical protein